MKCLLHYHRNSSLSRTVFIHLINFDRFNWAFGTKTRQSDSAPVRQHLMHMVSMVPSLVNFKTMHEAAGGLALDAGRWRRWSGIP